jgi:hypothetical protein
VSDAKWQLRVMPPARRQIDRLPIAVAAAVIETLDAIATKDLSRKGYVDLR